MTNAQLYQQLKKQKRGNILELQRRTGISLLNIRKIMLESAWKNIMVVKHTLDIIEETKANYESEQKFEAQINHRKAVVMA